MTAGEFKTSRFTRDIVGLVLPDIHVPVHDWRKLEAIEKCAADLRLDFMVQLGDLLDLESLGKFADGRPGLVEGERLAEDMKQAREVMANLAQAVRTKNSAAKVFMLEGNHEFRLERLYERTPYLTGMVDLPGALGFEELGAMFVRAHSETKMLRFDWAVDKAAIDTHVYGRNDWMSGDGIAFIHGWYANMHHAKMTAERYGRGQPIMYGHTHTVQVYTSHAFGWPRPFAASLGHLRLADADYIHGTDRWQPAFALVSMAANARGAWDVNIVRINEDAFGNSHFWVDGRRYSTRKIHGSR